LNVPLDFHSPEDPCDLARLVDDDRGAFDPSDSLAVDLLVLDHAVLPARRPLWIAQKKKGKIVLRLEPLMGLDAVRVDAENRGVDGIEPVDFVTEIDSFPRSAGSVVFGIEVEHDILSQKVLQRDLLPVVGME
jgi:hypothetical protein